jgi:hypothetical protein
MFTRIESAVISSSPLVIIPPLIEWGLYCNHLVCPSVFPFVRPSVCLSVHLSVCPSVCPSVRSHFRNRYLSFYWKKYACFCPFCLNLTSFPTFLTLQDKHNIRTLSLNIKFICTRCETGLKSLPKACYSARF